MDPRFTAVLTDHLKFLAGRELTEAGSLRDLGLDSMQVVELLFALEDAFGIMLDEEVLTESTFSTAGSLWQTVAAAIHDTGADPS
jgi:acyl carrier protein